MHWNTNYWHSPFGYFKQRKTGHMRLQKVHTFRWKKKEKFNLNASIHVDYPVSVFFLFNSLLTLFCSRLFVFHIFWWRWQLWKVNTTGSSTWDNESVSLLETFLDGKSCLFLFRSDDMMMMSLVKDDTLLFYLVFNISVSTENTNCQASWFHQTCHIIVVFA